MRVRLARKIVRITNKFIEFSAMNYQPYNSIQQKKALNVLGGKCPRETREFLYRYGIVTRVPLKYRKRKEFIERKFVW